MHKLDVEDKGSLAFYVLTNNEQKEVYLFFKTDPLQMMAFDIPTAKELVRLVNESILDLGEP